MWRHDPYLVAAQRLMIMVSTPVRRHVHHHRQRGCYCRPSELGLGSRAVVPSAQTMSALRIGRVPSQADGVTALTIGRRGIDINPGQRVGKHGAGRDTTRLLAGTRIDQMAATVGRA